MRILSELVDSRKPNQCVVVEVTDDVTALIEAARKVIAHSKRRDWNEECLYLYCDECGCEWNSHADGCIIATLRAALAAFDDGDE